MARYRCFTYLFDVIETPNTHLGAGETVFCREAFQVAPVCHRGDIGRYFQSKLEEKLI